MNSLATGDYSGFHENGQSVHEKIIMGSTEQMPILPHHSSSAL
jgi:hypothetical protein